MFDKQKDHKKVLEVAKEFLYQDKNIGEVRLQKYLFYFNITYFKKYKKFYFNNNNFVAYFYGVICIPIFNDYRPKRRKIFGEKSNNEKVCEIVKLVNKKFNELSIWTLIFRQKEKLDYIYDKRPTGYKKPLKNEDIKKIKW